MKILLSFWVRAGNVALEGIKELVVVAVFTDFADGTQNLGGHT